MIPLMCDMLSILVIKGEHVRFVNHMLKEKHRRISTVRIDPSNGTITVLYVLPDTRSDKNPWRGLSCVLNLDTMEEISRLEQVDGEWQFHINILQEDA